MYKFKMYKKSKLDTNNSIQGESIENKVKRILQNKEPIKDGAPIIYTERKDGVPSGYNIRTDRFEIALEGMSIVEKSISAKREAKAVIQLNPENQESAGGTTE